MILEKEFYFVRHGQTDYNISESKYKGYQAGDISLNETGKNQAKLIQSVIQNLPIHFVCSSPFKRAQETKEIITANLEIIHYTLEELGECSKEIWDEMIQFNHISNLLTNSNTSDFIHNVKKGLNRALLLPGTPLIVSHGGIHWAICCLTGIQDHDWFINNCIPVHFYFDEKGQWAAKKLL